MREIIKVANLSVREHVYKSGRYLDFFVESTDEEYCLWSFTEDEVRRLSTALRIWMEPGELRDGPLKAEI